MASLSLNCVRTKGSSCRTLSSRVVAGRLRPPEMIVLDANIPVRAILGRHVRQLPDTYATQGVQFFAPAVAFEEAMKYLPALLKKQGKSAADLPAALDYLQRAVAPVEHHLYVAFEDEARRRLQGRDQDDWPVLATALALACPVWTEDTDFFGTGIPVWTTNRVEIFPRAQPKPLRRKQTANLLDQRYLRKLRKWRDAYAVQVPFSVVA
jgi:predicted nucleic acid-binding protein